MTSPSSIMVFAAGRGTRMRPLTDNLPKPLIKVAGRTLLDHALDLAKPLSLARKVANIHAHPDMLHAHLVARGLLVSDERSALLETGGGLRHALPLLGSGPVFTLNTDAVWKGPNPLIELQAAWDPSRMDALLHLAKPENIIGHKGKGDFLVAADGRLSRGPGPVYTGAQIIKTERLAEISSEAFSLNQLWDLLDESGTLFGLTSDVKWCDVGQPESLPLAEELMAGEHAA